MTRTSDAGFSEWVHDLAVFDAADVLKTVNGLISDPKTNIESADTFYAAMRTICALRVTTFYASNTYCDNPFSQHSLERAHGMLALIFERAYTFAANNPQDPSLLLTLFYLKGDSPRFATALASAWQNEGGLDETSFSPLAISLLDYARAMNRVAPCGLSPVDYLSRSFPAVLDGLRYRLRYLVTEPAKREHEPRKGFIASCEGDYVALSQMYGDYDLILSIPGMSLSSVTAPFMRDLSQVSKQLLGLADTSNVELELSLSSSDQIYLSAALEEYSADRAKDEFARRISKVIDVITGNTFTASLLPFCHGMPRTANFFTQGALFVNPANVEHSGQLHEVLKDTGQLRRNPVPFELGEKPFFAATAIIHSRDVHARLDQESIARIVCGEREPDRCVTDEVMSIPAFSSNL